MYYGCRFLAVDCFWKFHGGQEIANSVKRILGRNIISPGRNIISPGRTIISPGRNVISPGRDIISPSRNIIKVCCNIYQREDWIPYLKIT